MDKGSKKQRKKGKKAVGQTQSQKQSVNIFFDGKPSVSKKKKKQRARRTGTQASRSVQPQRVVYQNQPIPLQPNYSTEINDLRNEVRLSRLASQVHYNQPTGFLMPQPRVPEKAPTQAEKEEEKEEKKEEKRREKVISRFEGEQGTAVQTEQGIPRAVRGTMEDMITKLEREARNRTEVSGTLDDMLGEVERRDRDDREVAGVMGGMLGEVERRDRDERFKDARSRAKVSRVLGGMIDEVEQRDRDRAEVSGLLGSMVGVVERRDRDERDRAEVSGVLEGVVDKVERDERMRLAKLHRKERKTTTIDEAMKDQMSRFDEPPVPSLQELMSGGGQGPAEEPEEEPKKKRGRPKMTEEQKAESARKRAQEREERLKQPVIGVPITPELEQVAVPKPREFQEGSLLADLEGASRLPQATPATSRLASRVSGSRRGVSFAEVEGAGGTFSLPEAPVEFPSDEDDEAEYEKYLDAQGRGRSSFVGRQSFGGSRASFSEFQDAEGDEPPQGSFI